LLTLTTSKRAILAILAGFIAYFAYPSPNFWPAIFVSVAGLYISVRGLKFWRAAAIGLIGGSAFYVAQIYWISQYLGPEPLIALAGIEAFIYALFAGVIGLISSRDLKPWALSLAVATVWTGREWFATHFPYGGFPWSRVAMSQSDSPLAFWVAIGGFGILSFLIVGFTVLILESFSADVRANIRPVALALVVLFAVPLGLSSIPVDTNGTMRIVGIQGNANAGLFAHERLGTIRDNHLDATYDFLKTGEKFDLVVWPENASDKNPDDDAETRQLLTNLVNNSLGKPLIFGTITTNGNRMYNSSKLWLPNRGEVDQYDKKRPVPFGEYVPDREFFYKLSPDLVGLISRGYDFGTRDGIFDVNGEKLGILICFEEAIDELPRDLVDQGASLIIAQTNNADFGHSDESVQQLAIARLRAIETGRSIVNISTVGPSAIIDGHGRLLDSSPDYVSDYVIADVPKSNSRTITMLGGWLFDPAMAVAAGILSVWMIVANRRRTTRL
jgi:apolipoprotein N-acyltransferase